MRRILDKLLPKKLAKKQKGSLFFIPYGTKHFEGQHPYMAGADLRIYGPYANEAAVLKAMSELYGVLVAARTEGVFVIGGRTPLKRIPLKKAILTAEKAQAKKR